MICKVLLFVQHGCQHLVETLLGVRTRGDLEDSVGQVIELMRKDTTASSLCTSSYPCSAIRAASKLLLG